MVGIMFTLGEVLCRFCLLTGHKDMAVLIMAVFICIFIIKKMVLHDRTIFFDARDRLIMISFIFGAVWSIAFYSVDKELSIGARVEGNVCAVGVSKNEKGYSVTFKADGRKYQAFLKDDEVICEGYGYYISGNIKKMPSATNPGEFDQRTYLKSKGVRNYLEINYIRRDRKSDDHVRIFLNKCRNLMADSIDSLGSGRVTGVLKAMLLGDKSDLGKDIRKMYQKNGIAHLLAISGLHTALIASFFNGILKRLKVRKKKRAGLTIVFLLMYGIMTGFSEATIRAFIIISAGCVAEAIGRTKDMPTALTISVIYMLIIRPDSVVNSGFLMSYAAAAGVITSDIIYRTIYNDERFLDIRRKWRKKYKHFVKGIIGTISINIFMLPILIYSYYDISLYSLLVNAVVIPFLSFIVSLGFIAGVMGIFPLMILPAKGIFLPVRLMLNGYEMICKTVLKFPGALINTGHVSWQGVIIYYILLIFLLVLFWNIFRSRNGILGGKNKIGNAKWRDSKNGNVGQGDIKNGNVRRGNIKNENVRRREKKLSCIYSGVGLIFMAIFLFFISFVNSRRDFMLFLDVGQGSSVVIHTKEGFNMIYDGGSTNRKTVGENVIVPALKYYGMSHIDIIFLSHGDEDHINGLIYILQNSDLEGIKVDKLCVSEQVVVNDNVRMLFDAAERCGCEIARVHPGMDITYGQAKVKIIYSGSNRVEDEISSGVKKNEMISSTEKKNETTVNSYSDREGNEINENSLVVKFEYHDISALFTGDIGSETEGKIIGNLEEADILQCPHHGSKYSSSSEFLRKVNPSKVIISCGKNNIYGHPGKETLERIKEVGSDIYRTDQGGAVTVYMGEDKCEINCFINEYKKR